MLVLLLYSRLAKEEVSRGVVCFPPLPAAAVVAAAEEADEEDRIAFIYSWLLTIISSLIFTFFYMMNHFGDEILCSEIHIHYSGFIQVRLHSGQACM